MATIRGPTATRARRMNGPSERDSAISSPASETVQYGHERTRIEARFTVRTNEEV